MKFKITPTGLLSTSRFLRVAMTIETTTSMHGGLVEVPIDWVLRDPIRENLDRAYRRQLIEMWSEQEISSGLF